MSLTASDARRRYPTDRTAAYLIPLVAVMAIGVTGCSYFDQVPREVMANACKIEFGEELPPEVSQTGTTAMSGFNAVANATWKRGNETVKREFIRLKAGQWLLRLGSVPLLFEPEGRLSARPIGCAGVFERKEPVSAASADPSETATVRVELKESNNACSGRYEIGGGDVDAGEVVVLYSFESMAAGMKWTSGQQYLLLRSTKNPAGLTGSEKGEVEVSKDSLSLGKRLFFPGKEFAGSPVMTLARVK
jgi:hypothetical protein